jgi:hypothetical protein
MTNYSQRDPRWSERLLDGTPGFRMKNSGCAVVATARIVSSVRGYDCPPGDWLTWLQKNQGFAPGARLKWEKVTEYLKSHNFPVVTKTWNPIGAKYVIWHVDFGPLGHFVNHKDATKTILDPYDGLEKSDKTYRRISGTIYYR